jgi:CelD/BcsL family acetyltransferase involved in cellulose biosynthesis
MLLLTSSRFGVVGSFCPAQTEICPVLISSIDELQTLIEHLPHSNLALQLYRQDPDYSAFPGTSSALVHEVDDHARTVCVDLNGEFAAFWGARSSKLRKNIGRILRIVARPGFNWRFTTVESPEAIELAVDRYGDLETQGWKQAMGTAVHSTNSQGKFYREIMRRFAKRGRGIVYELYFEECLVSSQMAIGNDTFLVTLKTTYNETFSEYSPGKLLDYLMLEHEFQLRRFARIEFCTNAGPELIRWGTRTRPVSDISVYRNEFGKRVSQVYRKLKRLKS